MGLSLREAEILAGRSRSGLLKAIKTGKLSATRTDAGEWRVDPVELSRVYSLKMPDITLAPSDTETQLLRERVRGLEDTVSLLKDTNADLRERLTRSDEERGRLTLMLTHSQDQPKTPSHRWIIGGVVLVLVGSMLVAAYFAGLIQFNQP